MILINKNDLCRQRLFFCTLNKRFPPKSNQNIIYTVLRMSSIIVIAYKILSEITIHIVYLHFPADTTMFDDVIKMYIAWNRQKLFRAFWVSQNAGRILLHLQLRAWKRRHSRVSIPCFQNVFPRSIQHVVS